MSGVSDYAKADVVSIHFDQQPDLGDPAILRRESDRLLDLTIQSLAGVKASVRAFRSDSANGDLPDPTPPETGPNAVEGE
jgi:hypothetical protein